MKSRKRYKLKFLVIFVFALCFFLNIYLFLLKYVTYNVSGAH